MNTTSSNNFWFGKRVLVTGADGFVAGHLIRELITKGALVVAVVRHLRPVLHNMPETSVGPDGAFPDIEPCDILDYENLRRICDRHQIDTIFHLAASAIVSDAANTPASTIENNVKGTLNVLEVARINKIPRVLITSTDKAYGDHAKDDWENLPYRENYALRGMDVYSASKVCADMLAQTYAFQFKVPIIVARSCNIFGPGDLNFTRLIPKTIMCLLGGKAPIIHQGNEQVLREYIYVTDVISAYLFLVEKLPEIYGENNANMPPRGRPTYGWAAFNIGHYTGEMGEVKNCEYVKSVSDIISMLSSRLGNIEPMVKEKPANFIEIPDQYLDSSKIFALGFKPMVSFADGLAFSINWYKTKYHQLEKRAARYVNG